MKTNYTFILCVIVVTIFSTQCSSPEKHPLVATYNDSLPDVVDYNMHVRPILSDKCFNCHGPDDNKRAANLRLDVAEAAYKTLESGMKGIAPGNIDKSEIIHRMISEDPELMMPIPESKLPRLTAIEVAIIAKWIGQGAEYKPMWSTIKPQKSKLPKVKDKKWTKNEIDYFVLSKIEKAGMQPTQEAERERLIRRLSFDLTGLPPSPESVVTFLEDKSENAYEKVVDAMLASPHYGERMALEWMDVARYADSHGYQDDGYRNSFRWRDWVIKAFNNNMAFDQFTIEQLAGDLLPHPTQDQMIATGFNRNHPQNQEGGIVDEEFRVEYVLDRVNTVGKAYLGLTVECARCHDHKYDPFSQKNYYEMSAFFNRGNEAGWIANFSTPGPTIPNFTPKEKKSIDSLDKLITSKKEEIQKFIKTIDPEFQKWKNSPRKAIDNGLVIYYPFDKIEKVPIKMTIEKNGKKTKEAKLIDGEVNKANKTLHADANIKNTKVIDGKFGKAYYLVSDAPVVLYDNQGNYDRYEDFSVLFWIKPGTVKKNGTAIMSRARSIYDGISGYDIILNGDSTLSFRMITRFPDNAIVKRSIEKIKPNEWIQIGFTYDGESKASGFIPYFNGAKMKVKTEVDNLTKGFDLPKRYAKRYVDYVGNGANNGIFNNNGQFYIGAQDGNFQYASSENVAFDEFRVFKRNLWEEEIKLLATTSDYNQIYNTKNENILRKIYIETANQRLLDLKNELISLRRFKNEIETSSEDIMVTTDAMQRSTYRLDRGAYDARKDTVTANTPQSVLAFSDIYPKNRLGLAQWLLDKDNPLTARVIVNRYWQMIFGQGIVSTAGDFGNQGSLPSHPELLDYLAVDFRESGWNVKMLLKKMVMSATYRQSSKASPEMYAKDPQNVYLARGGRYRMPFEMIRDHALQMSGLLSDSVGGASVFPYQPKNVWEEKTSGRFLTSYPQSHGEGLYRRSLYTFFKRTAPPPTLMTFDASDRSYCSVRKTVTNTPLQALVLLNDPQLLEAARVLAEKAIVEGGNKYEERISYVFEKSLSRKINTKELAVLSKLYQAEKERFKKNPKEAAGILNNGEYRQNRSLDPFELAAYCIVAHTVLNMDETITKS